MKDLRFLRTVTGSLRRRFYLRSRLL